MVVKNIRFDAPDYYGVSKKEREAIRDWEREEEKHMDIYPNATITEVRENAEEYTEEYPFTAGIIKRYRKRDFVYSIVDDEVSALYVPSFDTELKIMFTWNPKKRKWDLLTYKEGCW